MKKLISMLVVLCLCLSAIAFADGAMGDLYDKAVHLAFDTTNVTLTAEAEFKFDGEWFKSMHASYKQDGFRSYLSYMLDSPTLDGGVYTGGYTVFGEGNVSYSNDTYLGNYYFENATKLSDRVLVRTPKTDMLLGLGKLLALDAEDYVTQDVSEKAYSFKAGALDETINRSAYYLIMDYVRDNYYMDLFHEWDYSANGEKYTYVYYEDYQGLVGQKFQQIYGEEFPVDAAYDELDETTLGRYDVVLKMLDQMEAEIRKAYSGKVVYVKTDGTAQVFDSFEDYAVNTGLVEVDYVNYLSSLKSFYFDKYGEELTDETISIISFTASEELWTAYLELGEEMDEYYTQLARSEDPKAIYAVVREDGAIKTYQTRMGKTQTVTQEVMANISYASLASLDSKVILDDAGNLSVFEGTAEIGVEYTDGSKHSLEIAFTLGAKDYGSTGVPETFVPEEYGLVSYEEYVASLESESGEEGQMDIEEFLANAPKIISFMGRTFDSEVDYYGGEG